MNSNFGVSIKWLSVTCFEIRCDGVTVVSDPFVTDCAKMQVTMLYLLLCDEAKEAKKIIKEFKPMFASKEEYFKTVDAFAKDGDRITYNEDNTVAHVDIQ